MLARENAFGEREENAFGDEKRRGGLCERPPVRVTREAPSAHEIR